MSLRPTRSVPARIDAAALLLAILGMVIQIASGVKYPTVPPGIVILGAVALLITFVPWPPVRLLGVIAPGFILFGGFVSNTGRTNISHPGHFGPFIGTAVQFAGLAIAVLAGVAAIIEWRAETTTRATA